MLSTIITVILVCVMLSIIVGFIVSAVRLHRHYTCNVHAQAQASTLEITPTLAVLHNSFPNTQQLVPDSPLPASWFRRSRMVISTALLLMAVLTLFVQSGLADGALQRLANGIGINPSQHVASFESNTSLPSIPYFATANVVRVDSAARSQYYTDYQWQVWSYSSCSGISMEMVINAYGHHYIGADFLQKEVALGVWDVSNGLTGGEPAIAQTAAYFGFKALSNPPRTLPDLISTVNKGYPVIVGNSGHIFVVRGADNANIYIADSSPANHTVMTHAQFLAWWNGFTVVLVPR